MLSSKPKLHSCFTTSWARLNPFNLDVEMCLNLIDDPGIFDSAPTLAKAITEFGRQENMCYVFSNCAIMNGKLLTHLEAGVTVLPNLWKQALKVDYTIGIFPKATIIPYTQVRYWILTNLWNRAIPSFWKNNELAAKVAIMKAVMGEHAMRYWRGESGHAKMGVTWLHSGAAGTGKTYVLKLINALLGKGFPMVALSGSSTPVAIQILLKYVSNSSACIDDYVPPRGPDLAYQQLVRQIFDQTSRNIGGENARSYKCTPCEILLRIWPRAGL